ncbi:CU044_2847 family protein [Streptomyces sp. NPDC086023]|uniref:CU044_2847 family protein n=1 Tax=Streptomyces sp. NPDC086023 TaxID=3365746 RepID=UPI0037D76504
MRAVDVGPLPGGPAAAAGEATDGPVEEEVGLLSFNLDQVTASIGTFAQGVTAALRRAQPHRLTVEFGCQVGVEAGGLVALITKGTAEASLTVTMEWDWTAAGAPGAADGDGPAAPLAEGAPSGGAPSGGAPSGGGPTEGGPAGDGPAGGGGSGRQG